MSKNWIIFLLSLWLILLPFLGIPGTWRTMFIVASGFVIALLTLLDAARKRLKAPPASAREDHHETA